MATTPDEGNIPPLRQPPGTDMTGICFRDQLWLNSFPLDRNLVFDYFALSPFYDWTCNNEQLRMNSIHPLDISHLPKMSGMEYMLTEVVEPNLFVLKKQKRDGPEKVTPILTYYVLDGTIYQAPQLCNVFSSRIGRALYHISKDFTTSSSKLEKIRYYAQWRYKTDSRNQRPGGLSNELICFHVASVDTENASVAPEPKSSKEAIDLREVKRIDVILASLQRKLSAAPAPPPFPEGYVPPVTETDDLPEAQQSTEPQQSPIEF